MLRNLENGCEQTPLIMKVFVKTLANAHRNACELATLEFADTPDVTVRDFLARLQQNSVGVSVLLWGEDEMQLDDKVTDQQLLVITDQAAERLMQLINARDEMDRRDRDSRGVVPEQI